MSVFHRLTQPTYYGGLPGGFDYINNLLAGTPANTDGWISGGALGTQTAKSAGPNVGTYFTAFGEDATSADANRANVALATNTDYLDNLLRQDLVSIVRTANASSGAPTTAIVVAGTNTVWLGTGGYILADLFHIVDVNDQDIEVSGAKVVVASVAGGAVGAGFAVGNVTLNLNVAIPPSMIYRVYYCQRTNLATLPIDALTLPFMRNADSVDGAVVDFVAQISAPGTLGSAVTALEAYSFSTPHGRLAATNQFMLDCDPTDVGATARIFNFRTRNASVNRFLGRFYDDPTSALHAGLTGSFETDAGVGFSTLGTFFMQDANLESGVGAGMHTQWPLTSPTAGNGDLFPRLFELPVTSAAFGSATAPSLLRYTNGRWCCTVGDGTNSFGDFSGVTALNVAVAYAAAIGITQLHIQMKKGTYHVADVAIAGGCVIEGVSTGQTFLQGTGSATAMFNLTVGRLTLRNLTMGYASGAQVAVLGSNGTTLFMDDVVSNDLSMQLFNSATFNGIAAVHARRCSFAPVTAGIIAIALHFTDDDVSQHTGYYFDECSFICSDETQPIRIIGDPVHGATISGVHFNKCRYTLGGTTTTASHLTHNTGVLEVHPNGNAFNNMFVVDVTWTDCYPVSSTTAANAPLLRLFGVGPGDNLSAHRAEIGTVTIRGGQWACNQFPTATAISPFLLAADTIVIDGTIFVGNASAGGGPSSEDQYVMLNAATPTITTANWAQFVFAPGAKVVTQAPLLTTDLRLSMRDVSFRGLNQLSGSGDVWIYLSKAVDIDGVTLTDYVAGGTGAVPHSRLRISPNAVVGSIKGIKMQGTALGAGATWTTAPSVGSEGIGALVMLMPTSYTGSAQPHFQLPIEGLTVTGFKNASGQRDDGIVLYNNTADVTSGGWQYALIDCVVESANRGLAIYGSRNAGATFPNNGLNTVALATFSIIRGSYTGNNFAGILLFPDNFVNVLIDGVRTGNNGGWGIDAWPLAWNSVSSSVLTMVNSIMVGDSLGGAYFECDLIADCPLLILKGNAVFSTLSVIGNIRIEQGTSVPLTSPSTPGSGGFFIYGAETGIAGGGGSMSYANAGLMVENIAKLQTL